MSRDKTSLFISDREINYINDINTELIELVVLQKILYYAIQEQATQADELYGESIRKIFSDPIELYCRVFLADHRMTIGNMGSSDNIYEIEVYFQRDRVMKDLGFYPRIGDYISWWDKAYEIKSVTEPQLFGGLSQHKIGIVVKAIIARQDVFSTNKDRPYDQSINPDSQLRS